MSGTPQRGADNSGSICGTHERFEFKTGDDSGGKHLYQRECTRAALTCHYAGINNKQNLRKELLMQ